MQNNTGKQNSGTIVFTNRDRDQKTVVEKTALEKVEGRIKANPTKYKKNKYKVFFGKIETL